MRKISIVVIVMLLLGSCAETAPKKLLTLTKVFSSYIRGDVVGEITDMSSYSFPVLLDNNKIILTKDSTRQEIATFYDFGEKIKDTYFIDSLFYETQKYANSDVRKYGLICLSENNNLSFLELTYSLMFKKASIILVFTTKTNNANIIGCLNNEKVSKDNNYEVFKKNDLKQIVILCQKEDGRSVCGYGLNGKLEFDLNFENSISCSTSIYNTLGIKRDRYLLIYKYKQGKMIEIGKSLLDVKIIPIDVVSAFNSLGKIVNSHNLHKTSSDNKHFFVYFLNYLAVFDSADAKLISLYQTDDLVSVFGRYYIISKDGLINCVLNMDYENKIDNLSDDESLLISKENLRLIWQTGVYLQILCLSKEEKGKSFLYVLLDSKGYYEWYPYNQIEEIFTSASMNYISRYDELYIFCKSGNVYKAPFSDFDKYQNRNIYPSLINLKADYLTEEERVRFFGNK